MTHLRQLQRISSYGLARDGDAVLLVRTNSADVFMLPGGGVEHGEHPAESVVREFADLTGLAVKVDRLLDVGSDHRQLPSGIDFHGVFAVFGVSVVGGTLRTTADGPLEPPVWVPLAALPDTPLLDTVREIILNSG